MPQPKKPTALKLLEGNPGKRPLPKNEPKPAPIIPTCPTWFDTTAKEFFHKYGPKLHAIGLLTEVDAPAFEAVCQRYSLWVRCEKRLKAKGLIMTTESGYQQQRPEVSIAKSALADVKAFLTEFGMTPASRSRIDLKLDDEKEDAMEALLSGR